MKLNLDIKVPSSQDWLHAVLNHFDTFLQDHADCERKASAMAMSFVAKYPDRKEIIPELIETALEELEHFQEVYAIMEKRNINLPASMAKDPYLQALLPYCRSDRDNRFMDRLLIASIAETRGAERFKMVADNLQDEDLAKFYKKLWTSEAKHGHIFVKMALHYFSEEEVYPRLEELLQKESEIIGQLEIRSALH
ncbi:MAG: tRNA-(ms[2]io[6]A)-hydroxylase [Chitinophagales bacterium]